MFTAPPEAMHGGEANFSIFGPVAGPASVFTMDETPHLERRHLMLPQFHGDRMRVYFEQIRRITAAPGVHGAAWCPYAWAPFGGGMRRCLGIHFALFEMKTVITTVLWRARLRTTTPNARAVPRGFFLVPERGPRVVLEQFR